MVPSPRPPPPAPPSTTGQLARPSPHGFPAAHPRLPGSPPLSRRGVPASVPQSPQPSRREAPALARADTSAHPTPTAYRAPLSASAAGSMAGSGPVRLYTYSPTTHPEWKSQQSFVFLTSSEGDTIYYVSGPRTITFPYNVGRFFISAHTKNPTWPFSWGEYHMIALVHQEGNDTTSIGGRGPCSRRSMAPHGTVPFTPASEAGLSGPPCGTPHRPKHRAN
jgi:hypothetical protein